MFWLQILRLDNFYRDNSTSSCVSRSRQKELYISRLPCCLCLGYSLGLMPVAIKFTYTMYVYVGYFMLWNGVYPRAGNNNRNHCGGTEVNIKAAKAVLWQGCQLEEWSGQGAHVLPVPGTLLFWRKYHIVSQYWIYRKNKPVYSIRLFCIRHWTRPEGWRIILHTNKGLISG